jgi:hypothetical protein
MQFQISHDPKIEVKVSQISIFYWTFVRTIPSFFGARILESESLKEHAMKRFFLLILKLFYLVF